MALTGPPSSSTILTGSLNETMTESGPARRALQSGATPSVVCVLTIASPVPSVPTRRPAPALSSYVIDSAAAVVRGEACVIVTVDPDTDTELMDSVPMLSSRPHRPDISAGVAGVESPDGVAVTASLSVISVVDGLSPYGVRRSAPLLL